MRNKKILLTGGGTGGHVFPLVAVAEALKEVAGEGIEIRYLGPKSPWNEELKKLDIKIYELASSKIRRYFDLRNLLDIPKFFWSILQSLFWVYVFMPDVLLSKGGPGALAVVLAARFYFIPIIIHESDSVPGLTNRLSAKFAKRIAVSFERAARYFPVDKTIVSGNPVRKEFLGGASENGPQTKTRLGFDIEAPLVLILGGSQGAGRINDFVLENLEAFLNVVQVYHETGEANFAAVDSASRLILNGLGESFQKRYRAVPFFNVKDLKEAFDAADLIVSRAGAGAIYEIAVSGKPSILIPLSSAASDHQRENAYEYAKRGGAVVIEEDNFSISIVLVQIKNILSNKEKYETMAAAAKSFSKPKAAETVAAELLRLTGR